MDIVENSVYESTVNERPRQRFLQHNFNKIEYVTHI